MCVAINCRNTMLRMKGLKREVIESFCKNEWNTRYQLVIDPTPSI